MTGTMTQLRQRLQADPHRPRFHLAPPANWMNDPNGLIHWRGRYHAFYQYNPNGPLWGTIHWGHAVSQDLVHWEDLPVALAPSPDSPDADGCWSGCAVDDGGVATAIYTGYRRDKGEFPCRATSIDDDLVAWQKDPANPIIATPPPGLDLLGFRDHSIWRQGDEWRMVIGSGLRDVGGAALLYASQDLRQWRYLHPLCVGELATTGTMWECPDFFALGDRHVLLISPMPSGMSYALIGHYDGERFTPDTLEPLDASTAFYAPQTFRDAAGRRIMIGWLKEQRPDAELLAAGWAGMLALPRLLTLGLDGQLRQVPVPEIAAQRGEQGAIAPVALDATQPVDIAWGNHLDIQVTLKPGAAPVFLTLSDGELLTVVRYDPAAATLAIAPDEARLATAPQVPLALPPGTALDLRIFLDGSAIEVFANERACLTWRYYPHQADQVRLAALGQGAAITTGAWFVR